MSETGKSGVAKAHAELLLPNSWRRVGVLAGWRLSRQLAKEAGLGHPMSGYTWRPLARDGASDDVLFACDTGEVACVHLTWADGPASATFHGSVAAFARHLAEEAAHVAMLAAQEEAGDAAGPGVAVCGTCGADWGEGASTDGCGECGGFALVRTCPVCGGHCGAIWKRAIADSNDAGEAHWVGTCRAGAATA